MNKLKLKSKLSETIEHKSLALAMSIIHTCSKASDRITIDNQLAEYIVRAYNIRERIK